VVIQVVIRVVIRVVLRVEPRVGGVALEAERVRWSRERATVKADGLCSGAWRDIRVASCGGGSA